MKKMVILTACCLTFLMTGWEPLLSNDFEGEVHEGFLEPDIQLFITYDPPATPLISEDNLRKRWLFLFVEQLAKGHLENLMNDKFSYFDVYTTGKRLTSSLISIQVACVRENEEVARDCVLRSMDEILQNGFSEKDFEDFREEYLTDIRNLLTQAGEASVGPLFVHLKKEYETLDAFITFEEFLALSEALLKDIVFEELNAVLPQYFNEASRVINVREIDNMDRYAVQFENFPGVIPCFKEGGRGFSSLKRGFYESPQYTSDLYNQLPISENDKKMIRKIITTMAEKNVFQLLLEKKSLEKKGKKIRSVHPLRFLGFICSDGHLRKCLHSISKNHFKWSSFVDGFQERMQEEQRNGQLLPYVPGFADSLRADPDEVTHFINKSDYEGLIRHFI